ncbi:hypothetical protein A2634_03365 [Candidatus Amesbacteria bacterium RIFCSPHIGHO2_01_FULL_48_32]|uniref:Core-binding (CB) domain-containing protein n=1 Tax=Candidatus Amesbacteria bacterium RIFCSPLOWO2_01_FULL_48_25 TaxID=1797259 RepID=A0A1F4ZFA0_9BACT|nr:MAG: hypothetical protein A2634_03365 [Candidatus Amesbacteria bacterium RIFCSPHIGHO2_01_FULL_48_32]OGD04297.1 MAG: hypothetical protein A2989_04630 [Candidatus Amesbacteria bacterium RIFCSPLOWO2_01_FULL_48_25]HJZ05497.1 site-specific integrase [Patescibacteria group bacterium]
MATDYTESLRSKFAQFLGPLGVSHNTYKNYLSDLLHFFDWYASLGLTLSPENIADSLTPTQLAHYRDHLISHSPVTTANRRLSTLRRFCQFAFSQNILPSDPSANLSNISQPLTAQEAILTRFRSFLKSEGASIVTIKNYLSDARYFMQFSPQLDPDLSAYTLHLQATFSPSTALRRLSSAKKLVYFLQSQPPLPPLETPPPAPELVPTPITPETYLSEVVPEDLPPPPPPIPSSSNQTLLNQLDLSFPPEISHETSIPPSPPPSPVSPNRTTSYSTSRLSTIIIIVTLVGCILTAIAAYLLARSEPGQIIDPSSTSQPLP